MTGSAHGAHLARILFPELAAEFDAALASASEPPSGGGEPSRHPGDATAQFDSWLDERTVEARDTELGSAAFGRALSDGAGERFERAFAAARAVVSGRAVSGGTVPDGAGTGGSGAGGSGTATSVLSPSLVVPQPETFAAAGVDFPTLASAMDADPTLVPVPAPIGLGAEGWRQLFARARSAGAQPMPPGLVIASEVEREFIGLDGVPDSATPFVSGEADARGAGWTLRLVPAGLAPAVLGLSFAHGPHAALPELLMLQLMRFAEGDPLIDARSFTWVAGLLAGGRLAARHVYDASERVVRITSREVGNQGPHLGARPPIG